MKPPGSPGTILDARRRHALHVSGPEGKGTVVTASVNLALAQAPLILLPLPARVHTPRIVHTCEVRPSGPGPWGAIRHVQGDRGAAMAQAARHSRTLHRAGGAATSRGL
jgi:hypothetical protein